MHLSKNMKKLFIKNLSFFIVITVIFSFFIPKFFETKIPIPGDSIIGLYHPWRDNALGGYNIEKFPVKNPLTTDPVLQTYPWRNLVISSIKQMKIPFWNPYNFSGQPLLANIQSATFQITNIFFIILPFNFAWTLQIIAPLILSCLFMYLFLKSLDISNIPASFGALVLSFSGFYVSWLEWGTVITTAMWLPLTLLSINKLFKKNSALWFLILIFSFLQMFVSGHIQTAMYAIFAVLVYLLIKFKNEKSTRSVVYILIALLISILISAIQTIPFLEFISLSARNTDQGYYVGREDWFIPIKHLAQIVAPDFFGNPTTNNYWGVWNYAEFVGYVGIVPLTLALYSFTAKNKKALYFTILIFLSLLFGISNPISKIPYIFNLPFISTLQPSRILFLFVFSVSALSAIGLEVFIKFKTIKRMLFPVTLLASILVTLFLCAKFKLLFFHAYSIQESSIAIRNLIIPSVTLLAFSLVVVIKSVKKNTKIVIISIFLLTIFELFRFSYKFTPFTKNSLVFPQTSSLQFLSSQKKPFRVMSTDRRITPPNSLSAYKIESIEGYNPLYLNSYGKFITALQQNSPPTKISSFNRIITPQNFKSKLIALLNVKYILTFDDINDLGYKKVFEEGKTKIYEKEETLPRAYFVNKVEKVNSEEEEYSKLLSPDFDPQKNATSQDIDFKDQNIKASANIVLYNSQDIKIEIDSNNRAPLIISNIYYPGWKAYIDGKESKIFKANGIFQLIMIEKGNHTVEFKFQPKSFYNGLYISIFGIALSLISAFYIWQKKYL